MWQVPPTFPAAPFMLRCHLHHVYGPRFQEGVPGRPQIFPGSTYVAYANTWQALSGQLLNGSGNRLIEVEKLAPNHRAREWQSWEANSAYLSLKRVLPTQLYRASQPGEQMVPSRSGSCKH